MALFVRPAQNKVNLPHFPDALLRTTICPLLLWTMWGRTALVNEIVPRTLIFMMDRSTPRSVSNDKPSCKMPALFTRKSICNEKEHNMILTSIPWYICTYARFFRGFTGTITHCWLTNQRVHIDLVIQINHYKAATLPQMAGGRLRVVGCLIGWCALNIYQHWVNFIVNNEWLQDNQDKRVFEYFYHSSPSVLHSHLPSPFPKQSF